MSKIKSCPGCNRTYSDLSLSFCLEDGKPLSPDYVIDEEETVIKPKQSPKTDSEYLVKYSEFITNIDKIYAEFKKTRRTEKKYPILNSEPIFEQALHEWKSSDFVRKITFEVTGLHTFHAQENLVILREYLNEFFIETPNKFLVRSTLSLGAGNFYMRNDKKAFSYDFQNKNNPTKEDFIKTLSNFLNR